VKNAQYRRLCAVDVNVDEKWLVHMKNKGKSYQQWFFKIYTKKCGKIFIIIGWFLLFKHGNCDWWGRGCLLKRHSPDLLTRGK